MPLTSDNDLSYALDTNAAQASDPSVFEGVANLATKGIPLTALSVVNSFANTGIELGNLFKPEDQKTQQWTVPSELGDGDYTDYYNQHAQGIEAAGLVAGSLLPGLAAVKALKYGTTALTAYRAARAGELTGALARASGLLPGVRQAEIIRDSLTAISEDGVQAGLTASKFKAIALGFGDQALQGAVYQAATYATMSQSPLLKDDDFYDVVNFIKDGAIVGGAVGGLLDGIGTRAIFNRAILKANKDALPNLKSGELGKGPYFGGDQMVEYVNTLYEQPTPGTAQAQTNQLGVSDRTKSSLMKLAMGMSGGDNELSSSFTAAALKMRANGVSSEDAYNNLARLAKITRVGGEYNPDASSDLMYFSRFTRSSAADPVPQMSQVISNQAQDSASLSLAYRLKTGADKMNFSSIYLQATNEVGSTATPLYPTSQSAWDAGMDVWVGKDNKIFVNPKAPNIERAPLPGQSRALGRKEAVEYAINGTLPAGSKPLLGGQIAAGAKLSDAVRTALNTFMNLSDGRILNSINPTAADFGKIELAKDGSGVFSGGDFIPHSLNYSPPEDLYGATSRFAWAALRGVKRGDIIDPNDIPMLEQLYSAVQKSPDVIKKMQLDIQGANLGADDNALGTIGHYLHDAKNSQISEMLTSSNELPPVASNTIRLYRGEGGNFNNSTTGGNWFTADIDKAKSYAKNGGKLTYMDIPNDKEHMKYFITGHGGSDEYLTDTAGRESLRKLGIDQLPYSENSMQSNIDSVALTAGVPRSYLEQNMPATNIAELLSNSANYTQPLHAQLHYDISNLASTAEGTILRGAVDFQYRKQLIDDAMQSAGAKNLGANYTDLKFQRDASDADINGAGPSFLGFARAKYNSLAQEAERVGRMLTLRSQDNARVINENLALHAQRLRNMPELTAEVRSYFTALQSTGEKFIQLPAELAAKYFPDLEAGKSVRVLLSALDQDKDGNFTDWNGGHLPNGFQSGARPGTDIRAPINYYTLSKEATEFMSTHGNMNDQRIFALNNLHAAWGMNKQLRAGLDYAPPIDTSRYNNIAYVRPLPGSALNDGGVGVITGRTAEELAAKSRGLQGDYQIITKQDIKNYHVAEGDYNSNLLFNQTAVDSSKARLGILNEMQPNMQPERLIDDIVNWHTKQSVALLRANVETLNSQLFAELKAMGETSGRFDTSTANLASTILGSRSVPSNPYLSYANTALAVSSKENYGLWSQAQDKVEAFANTAFQVLNDTFHSASRGLISWEKAHEITSQFGLGNPYQAATDVLTRNNYLTANALPPQPYLRNFMSRVNSVMGTLVIKLDTFQQILHAVSTPIMALTEASSARDLLQTELPDGSGKMIPTASKVLFSSVRNFFDRGVRNAYDPMFTRLGLLIRPEQEYQFRQIMDNVRFPVDGNWTVASQKLGDAVQIAQKLMGTNLSERFTSWIAADVGRQLFETAGHTGQQLEDNIVSFATRVKGNFIASQRPVAFQGPIGQAIGLFQTYQTNLYQNFFRYVGDGETRSIATLAGAQSFLFGLSSLPGFAAMNNIIVGNYSGNPAHKDIYGASYNMLDKKAADWLLYGTASNLLNANFFTRGDVNPRNMTFLPLNPLNWPAVRGAVNFVSSLSDVAAKISQGGNTGASLLTALEHNGLNRPLQGLAQLAQGYSTTARGDIISRVYPSIQDSNTMGLNEFWNIGVFSRLLGARPLDEAIVNDAVYRKTIAQATDVARMAQLGESVKSTLYAGGSPTDDQMGDFMHNYMKSGGNIKNFSKSFLRWTQEANAANANGIYRQLQQPRNQNLMQIMGGQPMPDFWMNPASTASSQTE